jgi:DNA-binding response OmpR family regulator
MTKPRILVVADDAPLRATLARWLLAADYAVELAESPKRAREVIARESIALALVAPARLDETGIDLARELGGKVEHLIMIEEPADEAGGPSHPLAGNSIRKPLTELDVLARVKAALGAEPAAVEAAGPQLLHFGDYTLDAGGRTCLDALGKEVPLTRAEFSLLLAFGRQPGRVLSRDELSQSVAGRTVEPDDRSIDVLVSRVRRKIEPDPKAPRIILTMPGEGYKLAARSQAALPQAQAPTAPTRAVAQEPKGEETRAADPKAAITPTHRRPSISGFRVGLLAAAAAALAGVASLMVAFWYSGIPITGTLVAPAAPAQKFDASVVPLVTDVVRVQLAGYEHEPGAKAIALSREGWGVGSGAPDEESAKSEALQRCRDRDKTGFCRIYAVGNNVVWPRSSLPIPLPADIRADVAGMPLTSDDLVKIWQTIWHVSPPKIVMDYPAAANHRALAVGLNGVFQFAGRANRAEAIRLAIEKCSDFAQAPCLLLSVDGLLTFPLPQSHRIAAPFTLAGEPAMTEADRERIGQIYGGADWRALAKGQSGRWYAVGALANEAAAVEAALKACRAAEADCELYAIGNFRVGEKLETKAGG